MLRYAKGWHLALSQTSRRPICANGASVRAVEQPPSNYLRLDFGGALEDIEDARVAENSRNRKFEGKTVAAVYLHGIVGSCPSDSRCEQFGHARLEVATAPRIFLARRIIR